MSRKPIMMIGVPKELIKQIDALLALKHYGFVSRTEFIKEAIRWRLEYYQQKTNIKKNIENVEVVVENA